MDKAGSPVWVDSEIGELKQVLLHRPGPELEKLTPNFLGDLLFDDIPWLEKIREEHDAFAETLRQHGTEVFYCEDLLEEVLRDTSVRERLVDEVMAGCRVGEGELLENLKAMLLRLDSRDLAEDLMCGVSKREYRQRMGSADAHGTRLSDYIEETFPFYLNPLPNLYFTRDPGTVIGGGIAINTMRTPARMRESLLLDYIISHHPAFTGVTGSGLEGAGLEVAGLEGAGVSRWYARADIDPIEGGDILVLSPQVVAVGCSDRTSTEAIERLALRLFAKGYREVLVLRLPFTRAFMHLDTVFTMVDRDGFTIFPGIRDRLEVFRLRPQEKGRKKQKEPGLRVEPIDSLQRALKESLQLSAAPWD